MRALSPFPALLLVVLVALNLTACSAPFFKTEPSQPQKKADLMADITGEPVTEKPANDAFVESAAAFSLALFKETAAKTENTLISPLSVLLALAMTANGADAQTLAEIETVLADDIPLPELNQYLYTYVKSLSREEKCQISLANSIWYRDDEGRLEVESSFLQKNASFYQADIYSTAFDQQTVGVINRWVKEKTDGLIDEIIDEISDEAIMFLINAIVFDAEWERIYNQSDIRAGVFTGYTGRKQNALFMYSEEGAFIDDGCVTGFIKPYAGNSYSFVALLPERGADLNGYIASLSGERFLSTINSAVAVPVSAALPKFSFDYRVTMNAALAEMGMPLAFSAQQADFSNLGRSSRGNIYIGEVLHKAFIEVDERGTKAGAVTKVEMRDEAYIETKIVTLDRPFVFAIIDNATKLPLFLGAVIELAE